MEKATLTPLLLESNIFGAHPRKVQHPTHGVMYSSNSPTNEIHDEVSRGITWRASRGRARVTWCHWEQSIVMLQHGTYPGTNFLPHYCQHWGCTWHWYVDVILMQSRFCSNFTWIAWPGSIVQNKQPTIHQQPASSTLSSCAKYWHAASDLQNMDMKRKLTVTASSTFLKFSVVRGGSSLYF